jgi:hypothetical protein
MFATQDIPDSQLPSSQKRATHSDPVHLFKTAPVADHIPKNVPKFHTLRNYSYQAVLFSRLGVFSPTSKPQYEAPPLVGCPRLIIQNIRSYLQYVMLRAETCQDLFLMKSFNFELI